MIKISIFLAKYQEYPNSSVQEPVLELLGKFSVEKISKAEKFVFFSRESLVILLNIMIQNDLPLALDRIKKTSNKCMTNSGGFHSIHLLRDMISLLLDFNQLETATKIFDEYLQSEIDYESFNCYFIQFITRFPENYRFKVFKHFIDHFLTLDKGKFSQIRMLFNVIPPINRKEYVEICFEIINLLLQNGNNERNFYIDRILRVLMDVTPLNFEPQIIDLIKNNKDNADLTRSSLYLLGFWGSNKSIKLAKDYLNNTNSRVREAAFFCIRRINERKNIEWYNNEEII